MKPSRVRVLVLAALVVASMPLTEGLSTDDAKQLGNNLDLDIGYRESDNDLKYVDKNGNVGDTGVDASSIGGIGDFDGDGVIEMAYESTSDDLEYIDKDGNVVDTGFNADGVGGVGDFDGDGDLDIVYIDTSDQTLNYVDDQGNNDDTNVSVSGLGGLGDFDNDNDTEVVFRDASSNIFYADSNGNNVNTGQDGFNIGGIGDVDDDGDLDIVYRDTSDDNLNYFDSQGHNTDLGVDVEFALGGVGDFDGDSDLDIAYRSAPNDDLKYIDNQGNTGNTGVSVAKVGGIGDFDDDSNNAPTANVSTTPSKYGSNDNVDVSVDASDSNGNVTQVCANATRTNTTTTQTLNQSCRTTSSSTVTETFTDLFTVSDRGYNYTVSVNATDDAGATSTDSKTRTIGNTSFTDAFDVLGNNVGAFNVTINGETKTNGSEFITASSFNATFSKTGFFDKTASFTEGLDNEFTGVADANITVLVNDDPTGNTVNNYTATISNTSNGFTENKETTTGSVSFFAVQNATYNVTADSDTRPFTSRIVNVTSKQQKVTFNLKKERSLNLDFRQASDESLIDQETVNFDLISDVYSADYTTNNGKLNITLLEPATYRSRFSAPGYPERKTVFTVVDESTNQQSLYLRANQTGEFIEVTVLDETGQPEPGLRVTSQQYFLEDNEYKEQETSVTNTQGQVYQFLSFNDEYYQFTIRDSQGRLLKVTEPNYITSTTKEIQVQTATTGNTFYDRYQTISTTTEWNETPEYTAITEYTNNARIGEICQTIRAETITGSYQATKKCTDKATGALTQTWTAAEANNSGYPYSDNRYTARVTLVEDGQSYLLESKTLNQREELVLGTVGLIVQVIITGAAAMTALVTPSAALLVAPVTLLVGGIIGLHTINIAITTLLTVSGGILAYMTQRRNA